VVGSQGLHLLQQALRAGGPAAGEEDPGGQHQHLDVLGRLLGGLSQAHPGSIHQAEAQEGAGLGQQAQQADLSPALPGLHQPDDALDVTLPLQEADRPLDLRPANVDVRGRGRPHPNHS